MLIAYEKSLFSTDLIWKIEDFYTSLAIHFIGSNSEIIDFMDIADFNGWFSKEYNGGSPRMETNSMIGKLYQKLLNQKQSEAELKKNEFLNLIKEQVECRKIQFIKNA